MIAVVRCYKHTLPLVVEVFEGHDEQTEYKVLIDITCTDM